MKIVIANNKGGQGKTFFARLILWYLLKNPANTGKIAFCDVDNDQKNLDDAMRQTEITIYNRLEDIPEDVICVVDTPPSLTGSIEAIQQADILIVPIVLGKDAAKGVMRVHEIRGKNDLRIVINDWDDSQNEYPRKQFCNKSVQINLRDILIKLEMMLSNFCGGDRVIHNPQAGSTRRLRVSVETQNQKEVEEYLLSKQYNIISKLPKYKRLSYNLDHDLDWYFGMTEPIINYILNLIKNLLARPIGRATAFTF